MNEEEIAENLLKSITELGFSGDYAFLVIKDEDEAIAAIAAAIRAERARCALLCAALTADNDPQDCAAAIRALG